MPDQNFDYLFDRFQKNISNNLKGRIRERIIQHQLLKQLPQLNKTPLRCADIGGGLGQVTHWLASMGHSVHYCDVSEKMHLAAQKSISKELKQRVRFSHEAFQYCLNETYDFIHCQAVLEWLEHPKQGIEKLCTHVKKDGYLSLVFYNEASIILRNLVRGNLRAALGDIRGDGHGLTPINPLKIDTVFSALEAQGFTLQHWYGARCFTDYQTRDIQNRLGETVLFDAELETCTRDPFRSIARYVGIIARKHSTPPN